ncbi:MAG: hypothetical protein GPJ14_25690 [Microcystis aeruginosa G11-01]|nr:hypothetical protein [Microcystis aeruginosa G11-01]
MNLTIRRNAPLEQLGLKNVECRVRIYGDNLCLNLNLTIRRNAPLEQLGLKNVECRVRI